MRTSDRLKLTSVLAMVLAAVSIPSATQTLSPMSLGSKAQVLAAAVTEGPASAIGAATALPPGSSAAPAATGTADGSADPAEGRFVEGLRAYNAGDGTGAVGHWRAAADAGHLAAQWNLSVVYRRGDIVEADPAQAVRYLQRVASRHDPNRRPDAHSAMTVAALVELGDIIRVGDTAAGVTADPSRAARMYEVAATLYGDARAQHRLGMMHLKGEGVRQNISRAVRWLALSAKKRYVPSLSALGDFYWENRAQGGNRARGLMWLSLAKENVEREDLREVVIDRYNEALTEANEEERQRAMALIQNWNRSSTE